MLLIFRKVNPITVFEGTLAQQSIIDDVTKNQ